MFVDEGRVPSGEFPPVVCEFIDVLSEDLPGLPPIYEIEFTIDLVLSTFPIYPVVSYSSFRVERVEDSVRIALG